MELGNFALERVNKRLEVKKVRPVKTMWPSLIPTSYRNAAERTTLAARPALGYISADKPLNYPVSNSSVGDSHLWWYCPVCSVLCSQRP